MPAQCQHEPIGGAEVSFSEIPNLSQCDLSVSEGSDARSRATIIPMASLLYHHCYIGPGRECGRVGRERQGTTA